MATDVGTGTTITFTHTSKPIDATAEITSISKSGESLESIETTHMGTTGARSFIPADLPDSGELTVEGHFDPTMDLPNWAEVAAITISWAAVGTADLWKCDGFITAHDVDAPLEDKMTFSATFKMTGVWSKI